MKDNARNNDAQKIVTELDNYVQRRMEAANLPGLAAALIKNGTLIWSKGYGLADVERRRPATPSTVFKLASLSKLVTTITVLKAVEEGHFGLDDDVNKHLPFDVRNPNHPSAQITPRMLLSHTSSLRDNEAVLEGLYMPVDDHTPLRQFLKSYLTRDERYYDATLNFTDWEPGCGFEFSSIGMSLAAYLVERNAGQSFDRYATTHVLEPLGITGAAWRIQNLNGAETALPYRYRKLNDVYESFGMYSIPNYPDSGLHCSAEQLAGVFRVIGGDAEGYDILKPETVRMMRDCHFPGHAEGVGLGCYWEERNGMALLGHAGADHGVANRLFWYPMENMGVITLSNGEPTTKAHWALAAIETRLFQAAHAIESLRHTSVEPPAMDQPATVVPFRQRQAS